MKKQIFSLTLIFSSFLGNVSATGNVNLPKDGYQSKVVYFQNIAIEIYTPNDTAIKGDLLLLPGYSFSRNLWCDSTNVCNTALKMGYRVIAPEMAKSVYATKYFPETRSYLIKNPTLLWLDSAIGYLTDSLGMFNKRKYVLGLSTGARGVALLLEKRPAFFTAAAALSGDYNQLDMPGDRLMTMYYGPVVKYRSRWAKTDNPTAGAGGWKTPIYLGHGALDQIVPVAQTANFYKVLNPAGTNKKIVSHIDPKAGHTWSYWRSEIPAIWQFFNNQQ